MPGIAGIIGKGSAEENRAAIEAMVRCMQHERFYVSGTCANEEIGLWVSWTCLGGSFADCLPVWDEGKQICLIFSGEVFPDREEIEFLKSRGHQFQSGNVSYMVHLYEEIGPDFVKKLNGWFAGILIDLRQGKFFLFNDRYGMERIYFHEDESGFYFASEAKALLKVMPRTRQLDERSFAELLACGCVLQNRTLFSGISLVPGGSLWTFSGGQCLQKQFYFTRDLWETQPQLGAAEYYEEFKATWERILPRYFHAGEQAGLSLTGGVDSRMILARLHPEPGALPCYTWGSRYRDCNDVRLGRKIAAICGQSHQTIPLNGTFLSDFPKLAEKAVYISDGRKDVTGAADLYLHRIARQIAPVRLSGGNGGELLRRKVSFKASPLCNDLVVPEMVRLMELAAETYGVELEGHKLSFCAFKQAPWHMSRTFSLQRSQLTLRTPYLDNDLVALAYQAPPECLDIFFALRLISEGNPALAKIATDRGISQRSPPNARQIRHFLQQFTFKAEYAFDSGMPQWLARLNRAFAPLHLEKLFLGRHTIHHFRIWYRDELSAYIKEILLDPRTLERPYLRRERLESIVESHLQGTGNYSEQITRILTIELIQRQFLERNRLVKEVLQTESRDGRYVPNDHQVLTAR
jgi:asparagine synthase (glutamine-hydrolysing)